MHSKRLAVFRLTLLAAAALTLSPTAAKAAVATVPLDATTTYLRTNEFTAPGPATAIDLTALGFQAGDVILLERIGGYLPGGGNPAQGATVGVFSSTDTLAAPNVAHRVPGAIDAGTDVTTLATFNGSLPTNIPEDFAVLGPAFGGTLITIPAGAQFLFVSPNDSFFGDNINLGYSLRISSDPDDDGVFDNVDACPNSDMRDWVDTGAGPTSVANEVDATGCSIQDYVNAYAAEAGNHGAYVSAIADLADRLFQQGVISGAQKGELVSGAARSSVGK